MKPKCDNIKCENEGLVLMAGKLYCGDCVKKWNDKRNERLQEEMKCL